MSFAKNDRPLFEPSKSKRFVLPRLPPVQIVRIVLLALLGIVGAGWALARHYSVRSAPMEVPLTTPPAPAPTYDADAGEIPVPELETP